MILLLPPLALVLAGILQLPGAATLSLVLGVSLLVSISITRAAGD
jgi:hypothetical protein